MTMRKISVAVVLAALVAAIWIGIAGERAKAQAARTLASLETTRTALTADLRKAEARRTAAEAERSRAKAAAASVRQQAEAAQQAAAREAADRSAPARQPQSGGQQATDWRAVVIRDPKLQSLFLDALRAETADRYRMLYAQYKLTPEQIVRFEAATVKMQETEMDLYGVMQSADAETRKTARTVAAKAQQEYFEVVRELLGSDGPQVLRDYMRASGVRQVVAGFAVGAALAGVPINAEQAQRITQLAASASPAYQKGGYADARAVDWVALEPQFNQILTPAQAAAFQNALGTPAILNTLTKALQAEGLSIKQSGN
jgi:hypothetical protein